MAAKYAEANGLGLDERSFQDLGVSAFKGRNAEEGRLGDFLEAVREQKIPRGSYLLVESLDRISRQTARRALRTLEAILAEGITVVTLSDGRAYTETSLDEDLFSLISAILLFARANEESVMKGARVREAWNAKRRRASSAPMTKVCPAWLRLRDDRTAYEVIPERGEVVRRIFELAASGAGQHLIAATLNSDGVPTFGDPYRRAPARHWHRSYVAKILNSPAAVGTFVPHGSTYENGRRVRVPWEPVEGYFPAVVDQETARRAQLVAGGAGSNPRRGRHSGTEVKSLLAGLAKCPLCAGTMTRVSKGSRAKAGKPYLVCVDAKAGVGCRYRAVPLDLVEHALRARADELVLKETNEDDPELEEMEDRLAATRGEVRNLAEAIAQGGHSEALMRMLGETEARERSLRQEVDARVAHRADTREPLVERRMADLREVLQAEPFDVGRANTALRICADAVTIDFRDGQLYVAWRHGGMTDLTFAMPDPS